MGESCILTYKKPQKLRFLKSNIPPSQVKSTKILVDLTLIRQGDVIHILTRKKMVLDDHYLICVLIYMKNYKESKIYNIIKCGIRKISVWRIV